MYFQATEEQMISAGKLMRDVCLPKFNKVSPGNNIYDALKMYKLYNYNFWCSQND